MAEIFAVSLFAAGYLAITMEHRFFLNKAAASMILAVALWLIVGLAIPNDILQTDLISVGSDVFGIVIFLLCAMTLVEILVHYHTFDIVELWLRKWNVSLYHMGWIFAGMTYLMSTFIANLTITIVMIQLTRRFFPKEYLLPIAAIVIITSNTGGSFSPIGDVNTIMLWFAHKFTALEILSRGFLPSLTASIVASYFLLRSIPKDVKPLESMNVSAVCSRSDKAIIFTTLIAFLLPLLASVFHIPAYMGLIAGLGGVWLMIDFAKHARPQETHLQANIKKFMQQTDIESILFFVGILLAVAALHSLGILDHITHLLLGAVPSYIRTAVSFVTLGLVSAVIDNVPLTAAAISSLNAVPVSLWVLLALSVTSGGSLLIIGSASGVVAMGMIHELTFGRYLRAATLPALLGFIAGISVWVLEAVFISV